MNASDYFVSIITVVKNEPEGLENTIKSVLQQTYRSIEYIVIDGKSDDDTIDVINTYKDSISKLVSEPDTGIYNAMNKGIKIATGEYLLFLNAGDTLSSPDLLTTLFAKQDILLKNPKIIYGGVAVHDENGEYVTTLKALKLTKRNLNIFSSRTVCHQSIFIRCDCAIPYNESYKLAADVDWYYSLLETISQKDILRVTQIISNYRLGGMSSIHYRKNNAEVRRIKRLHNSTLAYFLYSPFFLIPAIFRLKQYIFCIIRKKLL